MNCYIGYVRYKETVFLRDTNKLLAADSGPLAQIRKAEAPEGQTERIC